MAQDKHRTALVTGGMGGLGEAICVKLAALGYTVVTTHSPGNTKAREWLESMRKQGLNFHAYPCDVVDWDSCVSCVSQIAKEVGPVDVLVNNAGITRDGLILRMTDAHWDEVLSTNLQGAFRCCRVVARPMMKARYGRIVNVSSVVGLMGNAGQANYAASKAGLLGLTKSLARELSSRNVTVNAVCPGYIETEMTGTLPEAVKNDLLARIPLGRLGRTGEVADVVTFLASPRAGYVTGQAWAVDGGMVM